MPSSLSLGFHKHQSNQRVPKVTFSVTWNSLIISNLCMLPSHKKICPCSPIRRWLWTDSNPFYLRPVSLSNTRMSLSNRPPMFGWDCTRVHQVLDLRNERPIQEVSPGSFLPFHSRSHCFSAEQVACSGLHYSCCDRFFFGSIGCIVNVAQMGPTLAFAKINTFTSSRPSRCFHCDVWWESCVKKVDDQTDTRHQSSRWPAV